MKNIIFILALSVSALKAQITPDPNTNSGTTPVPINPGQTTQPYNGTNPAGQPNQINPANPIPGNNNNNYQPTVQPNPVLPTTPAAPGTSTTPKINRLFQDPVRTPRDPKQVDPVRSPDGSTGKHHKPKKAMSGKTFAHNHSRVKKSKSNGNAEKSRNKNATESTR